MRAIKLFPVVLIAGISACGPSSREDLGNVDAQQMDAPCNTALTGKVFAPNGTLPLYNVLVYVPETQPLAFPTGVQCSTCADGIPGGHVTKTTTDAEGKFRLEITRPGSNVDVIITTGKWRRRVTVPNVQACVDTPIPDGMFRLPKNRTEGEMPRIAQVTGGCDELGCILSKLGIDAQEFGSSSSGPQAVTFYNGQGGTSPGTAQPSTSLWGSLDEMKKFDIIINSCECSEYPTNKTAPDLLRQYADLGGRVFGSHFHYVWTKTLIPQWQTTATWTSGGSSSGADLVDISHPTGEAFSRWLVAVGASAVPGQVQLNQKIPNVSSVNPPTLRWLYSAGSPGTTHYLSFNTPVGAPAHQQCGKVVYAGMHVASGSVDAQFPANCGNMTTADEKALIFLLFDLGACVDVIL